MFPLLVAGMGLFAGAAPPPQGLTLPGVVQDSAGRPLPRATVFVRTAGPREGVGVL
jgi:hypothetical protein